MSAAAEILALLAKHGYHVWADETPAEFSSTVYLRIAAGRWEADASPEGGHWQDGAGERRDPLQTFRMELPSVFFDPGRPEVDQ